LNSSHSAERWPKDGEVNGGPRPGHRRQRWHLAKVALGWQKVPASEPGRAMGTSCRVLCLSEGPDPFPSVGEGGRV
jgi:hypothetical protein